MSELLLENKVVRNFGASIANKQLSKDSCCKSLTFKQRMIGFIGCLVIGAATFVLALFCIPILMLAAFCLLYTISTACLIGSTFFFVGPKKQL